MKKLLLLFSVVALTAFKTTETIWTNDDPHSQLGFTVTHLGITDVSGTFNDLDATVTSSKPDFSDAVFKLTAQTASIYTRVEARDNHLRSADFFDVEKYPTIDFESNAIKNVGKNKYKLTGELTIHGITKTVTMDLAYTGKVEDAKNKKQIVGFQVTGVIKRSDFKVGTDFPPPMISDEVRIKADGEFAQ